MIFNTNQCYWGVTETFRRKESLTKHRRKKSKDSKESAKNGNETRRLLNHIQGYGRVKENWDKWIWNRDSPSRVWFGFFWLRCRCSSCPGWRWSNWQLDWIKSMSINTSELRKPRRCLKDVGGEPTGPTSFSWLIAWFGPGYSTTSESVMNGNYIHPSRLESSGQWLLASGQSSHRCRPVVTDKWLSLDNYRQDYRLMQWKRPLIWPFLITYNGTKTAMVSSRFTGSGMVDYIQLSGLVRCFKQSFIRLHLIGTVANSREIRRQKPLFSLVVREPKVDILVVCQASQSVRHFSGLLYTSQVAMWLSRKESKKIIKRTHSSNVSSACWKWREILFHHQRSLLHAWR